MYKHSQFGNIEVLNAENKLDKYIYISSFPSNNEDLNAYLLEHKEVLLSRKIKTFNEENWFEWGAPRNIKRMEENKGNECIYVYNLTRKKNIAFKGTVGYFGGGLIMLKPKVEANVNLDRVVQYLNSDTFKKNFIYSGRFKIGQRQLCNTLFDNKIDFKQRFHKM